MIQIGDKVRMRLPEHARTTGNVTFTIAAMPGNAVNDPVWWELVGDTDGLTYVFTMLAVFTIEPPP